MSDTIYRPLFVFTEMLEGAVKAALPQPDPMRPKVSNLGRLLDVVTKFLGENYSSPIRIWRRADRDTIEIEMKCRLCGKWYTREIDTWQYYRAESPPEFLAILTGALDKLESEPCKELALENPKGSTAG